MPELCLPETKGADDEQRRQIDEMAEVLWEYGRTRDDDAIALGESLAEYLIDNDYRKSTDVAEEIFAEIEKSIADLEYRANTPRKTVKVEELKAQCDWILHEVVPKALAELKKKYTEGENNNE
jgi:hypothetical protein